LKYRESSLEKSDKFSEVAHSLEEASRRIGVSPIKREDGIVLSALSYYIGSLGGRVFIDAGAGIGYSTLWILHGLSSLAPRGKLVLYAVERDPLRRKILEENIEKVRKEIIEESPQIEIRAVNEDAVDFLEKVEPQIDMVFVDIEKRQYKEVLRILPGKLSKIGIGIFHNVLVPGLDDDTKEFLEQQEQLSYHLVPTSLGLLVVKRLN
jgi:predicted O-methyltransferase YrrM